MNTENKRYRSIARPALATGAVLLVPLIAMQFTDEVVWTLGDFIAAGTMIFGTGLTYQRVTRKTSASAYRIAVGFALASALFLIWANLAVGIVGTEDNPVNLWYFGVVAVGIIGTLINRFQPDGMVLTMFAMALAQALVAAIALIGGYYQSPPSSVFQIIAVNGFFILLFIVSALLFRYAAAALGAIGETA